MGREDRNEVEQLSQKASAGTLPALGMLVWAGQDCKSTPTQVPQVFVCLLILTDDKTESHRDEMTGPRS